jgi:hypothetical protein
VANGWLRVTVKANASTRLAAPDVFYFGNLIGEIGDPHSPTAVTAFDLVRMRRQRMPPTWIQNPSDVDRNGAVNARDVLLVRNNLSRALPMLPAEAAAGAGGATGAPPPLERVRPRPRSLLQEAER